MARHRQRRNFDAETTARKMTSMAKESISKNNERKAKSTKLKSK